MAPGPNNARVESDPTGVIDVAAFNQILELEEDDTLAYSRDMIAMYFAQAPETFAGMDAALAATDLRTLADLAHFLMGSSATLGIARVAASCERMEGLGEASLKAARENANANAGDKDRDRDPRRAVALEQIAALLAEVKREYADAERWLRDWYADHGQGFDEPRPVEEESGAADTESELKSEATESGDAVDAPPQLQPPPKYAPPPATS
ncbi:signal transduction histidine kinase [Mycena leptocephala]|nr:signal transduction histidine kinase [Mycena leptocephala]